MTDARSNVHNLSEVRVSLAAIHLRLDILERFVFDNFSMAVDTWTPGVARATDDLVLPVHENHRVYRCTVAGSSGSSEPTWPTTDGSTVADGDATWACVVPIITTFTRVLR